MPCSANEIKSGKLLIRINGGDGGARPLEPCTNFWASPDLFLTGGIDNTTALVGANITVNVRVKNISTQPIEDVNVEASVCDYTMGPLGPATAVPGTPLFTGFFGGPLGPNSAQVIACSPIWTPTAAQAAVNGGHVCLAANAFADSPADGAALGGAGTIKVCCASHHGQANISVVAAKAMKGRQGFAMEQGAAIVNGDRERELRLVTTLEWARGPAVFGAAERALLRSGPFAGLKLTRSRYRPLDLSILTEGAEPGSKVELTIPPGERAELLLTAVLSPKDRPGSLYVLDAISWDPEVEEIVGASRLLVLVPPER